MFRLFIVFVCFIAVCAGIISLMQSTNPWG